MSLSSTLNRFNTLFWCFYCWFWTSQCQLGSVSHIIKLQKAFDSCDIWLIKNAKTKSFTFSQKQFSGIIQLRLYYLFLSNSLPGKFHFECILNRPFPSCLSISQRQPVIKLLEKKTDKRYIKKWRPTQCWYKNNFESFCF